jgi:NAD+ synthase (glutamine-hydrolysing)
MQIVKIAACTLNQTPLDWSGNVQRIKKILAEAKSAKVGLLVMPELCITGYGCEDAFLAIGTARRAALELKGLLAMTRSMTVVFGLPVYHDGSMYNCAVVVQDGKILGVNPKRFLPREGVHYEPRWFAAWPVGEIAQTRICGQLVAFGDVLYNLGGVGVAVELCEEAWGAASGASGVAGRVDLVVNPSASHFSLGKYRVREQLVSNLSRAMQVVYVYSNLVGNESGRIVYDGGAFIAQSGTIKARGRRFGFSDGELTSASVDLDVSRMGKLRATSVRARQKGIPVAPDFVVAGPLAVARRTEFPEPPAGEWTPEREFLHAQMVGLFDYLRKSGARCFVLPLSGGCDSSTCAVLIAHMVAEALRELGSQGLAARLGTSAPSVKRRPIPASRKAAGRRGAASSRSSADPALREAWTQKLLVTFYQASAHSGEKTLQAARTLALALGAEFQELAVQPVVDACLQSALPLTQRKLSWQKDDVTLQNIQPRARAAVAWLIANVKGGILISTGNRSEASVGYTTMDGDSAGGLAPLGGIDKFFLQHWLRWAETVNPEGRGPVPELRLSNALAPSAELRPAAERQQDEKDLMPYEVLALLERLFVLEKMGHDEMMQALSERFSARWSAKQLSLWLSKFERLWRASQWKRERLAPSLMIDSFSVDPRGWFRWPILAGDLSG